MRINKYIASCTKTSRRKAEELVLTGKVKVNDEVTRDLSTQIGESDKVYLDGKMIAPQEFVYYALNKPVGYTTTTSDPHAKKIITDLVPNDPPVFPVGRLDKNTSGLIILTNDGDFAQKMTHPKYEKEKEYIVETDNFLSEKLLDKLRHGVELEDGKTAPAKIKATGSKKYSMIIHEGKNRQIRRMIEAVGAKVITLKRIRIEDFELEDLAEGEYKTFLP
ncbi:MAG: pseudouridine synthase [bacterium]|nr:pseudouridine synthase [bacterium]